ncbi:MAG: CDP-alcohol phosphatidyltransferase family protein [Acidobacteria bacterium]|nr:CDP-alcohol phosphatidyltransferase family protein [Acidobacteriota bacterium]MYK88232.1 CDP-alcohol phosphatidyltransferase family protein [Acidobacteriota bacterium]
MPRSGTRAAPTSRSTLPRRALTDLGLGLLPLAACALTTSRLLSLSPQYFLDVAGIYALLAALIVRFMPRDLPRPGLGAANQITLVRATLVIPTAALVLQPAPFETMALWWIAGVAAVAIALDGLDGFVARRSGQETGFGARFDMELDSFLMLALSALVWRAGRADAWVLLVGAPRYLFVAAGWIWSALTAELPPRFRRKTVCVVQGVALIACLLPVMPVEHVPAVAAGALALLAWSFGVDIIWLIVHAPGRVRPRRA